MRAALVSEHASPLAAVGGHEAGGQNVHVAALALALGRLGVDTTVYTRRDDPRHPAEVPIGPNVRVRHLRAGPAAPVPRDELLPLVPALADGLAAAFDDARPDVCHAHFWMSGLAALEPCQALGVPVVQTFHALGVVKRRHQGAADTSPPAREPLERELARRVDHIVATCSDEVFELVRLGADRRRLSVVPCGVDLDRFAPAPRTVADAPGGEGRRVLCVGRLVPRKGVDDVVRAVAMLPAVELVIAGGPEPAELATSPEAAALLELAASLGCDDRVRLVGRVARERLPELYRSADVVVCTPWYEPFGIVPVEAAACGVPVIASAVGGLVDTVVDRVTGLLVPPRSPLAIAGALRRLLADDALRLALGDAAARRARERYGWDRIARATLGTYERVASSSVPAAEVRR